MAQVLTRMRSASSGVAAAVQACRPSSSAIRWESASFIWQPKVWTNTLPARGAAAGAGIASFASVTRSGTGAEAKRTGRAGQVNGG